MISSPSSITAPPTLPDPTNQVRKMAMVAELHEVGVEIQRENIRRANPSWSDARVGKELRRWLGFEGYTCEPGDPFVIRPPRSL